MVVQTMGRLAAEAGHQWRAPNLEPERGFEPLTYALRMRCSTN